MISEFANEASIDTKTAHNDCDTVIVKTALDIGVTCPVDAIAENTDILVMLIHLTSYTNISA